MVRATKSAGFSLGELLIVLAIVAILAAVLFPVFRNARVAANKAVAISNFRQGVAAALLYASDYDDGLPPSAYDLGSRAMSSTDRKWPQLLSPYVSAFSIFLSPADPNAAANDPSVFDPDVVPNDPLARFYEAAQRVNMGYNHRYLSPVVEYGNSLTGIPVSMDRIGSLSATIAFVESVYDVTPAGEPLGGGRYIIDPPCRFAASGEGQEDTFPMGGSAQGPIFDSESAQTPGWGGAPATRYGGAWPWHGGQMTVGFLDGSAKAMRPGQLSRGCDAKPNWQGLIGNRESYAWDLQ